MDFDFLKLLILIAVPAYIFSSSWKRNKFQAMSSINGGWHAIYSLPFEKNASISIETKQEPNKTIVSTSRIFGPEDKRLAQENTKVLSSFNADLITAELIEAVHQAALVQNLDQLVIYMNDKYNVKPIKKPYRYSR